MSVANALLEKTPNRLLKNPPNDPSTRSSRAFPNRKPSATRVASPTTAHPLVVVSGPRHTASSAIPDSRVRQIEIAGISPILLGMSSSSNQLDAISPGSTTKKNRPASTRSVCSGLPNGPG